MHRRKFSKRWIVERSFAWLEKYRRLFKIVERKPETSKQMVVIIFLSILIKREDYKQTFRH
ncbi:transposase [Bacillus cereus]|uniref:transposase n=1 Tax=Bacillus cereus TaxID=1396 RepID=UPI0039815857